MKAKRIKAGEYLYRGFRIKRLGYHAPDRSVVWEATEGTGEAVCGFTLNQVKAVLDDLLDNENVVENYLKKTLENVVQTNAWVRSVLECPSNPPEKMGLVLYTNYDVEYCAVQCHNEGLISGDVFGALVNSGRFEKLKQKAIIEFVDNFVKENGCQKKSSVT